MVGLTAYIFTVRLPQDARRCTPGSVTRKWGCIRPSKCGNAPEAWITSRLEYEAMPRFTVRSLMYVTAVIAALALLVKGGPSWVGFTGYVIYACLLLWHIIAQDKVDRAKMRERRERGP